MFQMFSIVTHNFLNVLFDIDSRIVAMEVGITKECITTHFLNQLVLKMEGIGHSLDSSIGTFNINSRFILYSCKFIF